MNNKISNLEVEKAGLETFKANDHSHTQKGAAMVEYALLLSLVAVVCIGAVSLVGMNARDIYTDVNMELASGAIQN